MQTQIGHAVDSRQHIDVTCDQRTFRNHDDAEAWMLSENLENSSRDLESSLGRLIWIGRCSDHNRLPLEECQMSLASITKRATQNLGRVVLDENISLEGEPRRKIRERFAKCLSHFVVIRCAFHHVSMGVPRVAIRASERASDIRVDGPVAHPCSFRSVENTLRRRAVVASVFLNIENG